MARDFTITTEKVIGLIGLISEAGKADKKKALLRFSDGMAPDDVERMTKNLGDYQNDGYSDVYVQCKDNKVMGIFAYNKEKLAKGIAAVRSQGPEASDLSPLETCGHYVYRHKDQKELSDPKQFEAIVQTPSATAGMLPESNNATEPTETKGTGGKSPKKNKPVGSEEHKDDEEKTQGDDGSDSEDSLLEGSEFGLKPKPKTKPIKKTPQDREQTNQEIGMQPQKLPPRMPPRSNPPIPEPPPHVVTRKPMPRPPEPPPPSHH